MLGAYPGSLGNIICDTTPVCTDAQTAVQQMDAYYQANSGALSSFQSSHDSIMASWTSAYGYGIEASIPFANNCCQLQTIGQQAWDLLTQMQTALGQTPQSPSTTSSLTQYIVLAAVGYLIFVYFASHK